MDTDERRLFAIRNTLEVQLERLNELGEKEAAVYVQCAIDVLRGTDGDG